MPGSPLGKSQGAGGVNNDLSGQPNKLPNSNEKLEQRYKEIMKENDGKLFEVHMKKGQAGAAPLLRSLSTTNVKGYPLMMVDQVFRRQLSQQSLPIDARTQQQQDELIVRCLKGMTPGTLNMRNFPLF